MNIYDFVDNDLIKENEMMSKHTSFKTGGVCRYMIMADSADSIIDTLRYCKQTDMAFIVIGCGSNLLISDKGFDGVVIQIADKMSDCFVLSEDDEFVIIRAYAGCRLSKLAMMAAKYSCTGMEALSGIPGSVGGGVRMNAGAYDGQIADVLISSQYIDINTLEIKTKSCDEHLFNYRYSTYQDESNIILSADFKVRKVRDSESVYGKMKELNKRRADKQPLEYPSAGSTFRRPQGYYAGALIEESGLKGFSCGGACVSEKHAGFIINKNNATSKDIYDLITYVRKKVMEDSGVVLETEVEIIGQFE
ncbi:MAG: UDP-N-acetylmuramate dehydrogenase [Ruminococcaceae bacterium]|nr:UDP-N-acetylmuramate dehydrogenase [Oscillospiraceae bacterium]